ncbi:hypothetical protein NIES2135_30660 [Leptolyngbya boryana NIES-2135]|jgi:hypothetical protein|uniref:Glutathione S-transferase n=1 Tax=Leptolyngbya boryana NIES-2135 TaxID=1973484 RepID=A0A1Z4JHM7_LEPBY|nr:MULTISPECIES: hypothetical protein [Leptolyngbya]BAY56236.1 hypothetical protein NIES2135_30660 [Leptolyngbya boryana NIES-2135]MBD2366343.1 hypothetical protein [Leptolyngbya sp. FACHB-161]MBD2372523.1 hypothetical protein [Leptolyngbya sp. FACHB-238]MBD2396946.1 hypothetical protein [Leptolyngbya sp. FACHB-239]MBD2403469.1 hypothetical protein [Leptolyngbya sp. FACHB-402]
MNWKLVTLFVLTAALPATALPPPEDLPEEVARTEIITEARSPIDNKRLTAAEYADLQAQLQQRPPENPRDQVSPELRRTIGLLRLRKFIRTVFPFIPIR